MRTSTMTEPTTQHFQSHRFGSIVFRDRRQQVCSALCQPRDIEIVNGPDDPRLLEEIAVDIRLGQGRHPIGVARQLLHRERPEASV